MGNNTADTVMQRHIISICLFLTIKKTFGGGGIVKLSYENKISEQAE